MAMKKEQTVYSFWNGKNLNGKQEFADQLIKDCTCLDFPCIEGDETTSADDLS